MNQNGTSGTFRGVFAYIIRSIRALRNYNGDGKGNVKKSIVLTSKTTFRCCPWTTTTSNDLILSLLENGNDRAINSTISV